MQLDLNCDLGEKWGKPRLSSISNSSVCLLPLFRSGCYDCSVVVSRTVFGNCFQMCIFYLKLMVPFLTDVEMISHG